MNNLQADGITVWPPAHGDLTIHAGALKPEQRAQIFELVQNFMGQGKNPPKLELTMTLYVTDGIQIEASAGDVTFEFDFQATDIAIREAT